MHQEITIEMKVISISYEYDGFLILTEIDKCDSNLSNLNEALQAFLKQANLFPMTFEQKDL